MHDMTPPLTVTGHGGLNHIALIEDDDDFRSALGERLELAGFKVEAYSRAEQALSSLSDDFAGVVISDLRMPGLDGRQVLTRLQALDPSLPVILITGHGDVADAVMAMREGAYDFVTKPFAFERLFESLKRALEKRALVLDNRRLAALAADADVELPLLGDSTAIRKLRATITQIADARMDVLIEGETGTGKEAVARALHSGGRRRPHPFVAVNCGALPEGLIESELFGHEMGAFAGAMRHRIGHVERAHNGSLFLDAVESMPVPAQVKLLRVLEEREIHPIGAHQPRHVDLRVMASATGDLQQAVAQGRVREDLYYRLNVVRLFVPPLRERREDIPLIFASLLARVPSRPKGEMPQITDAVRAHLMEHDWPGNIRELSHYAQRFALGLETTASVPLADAGGLAERVARFEASILNDTLQATGGNVAEAMSLLQLPRKTLYDKLKKYGIQPSRFRASD